MDTGHDDVSWIATGREANRAVIVVLLGQALIAIPSVGTHIRPRFDSVLDKRDQAGRGNIFDTPEPHPSEALGHKQFNGDGHGEFTFPAASLLGLLNASDVSLIDLDRPAELFAAWTYHGRTQLAQHRPGGLIAAQAQQPL